MRVWIFYHIFNNLDEQINGDPVVKIGRGILSCDIMYINCNYSITSKVNGIFVYKGKLRLNIYIYIYELKWSMHGAIYIGNTQ